MGEKVFVDVTERMGVGVDVIVIVPTEEMGEGVLVEVGVAARGWQVVLMGLNLSTKLEPAAVT